MLGGIGPTEAVVIVTIVLAVFGVGRLPEIGGALGKGIRNFKSSVREVKEIGETRAQAPSDPED